MLITTALVMSGILYSSFRLYQAQNQNAKQRQLEQHDPTRLSNKNLRTQQLQAISSTAKITAISNAEKQANQKLKISLLALGLTVSGYLFYPPLLLVSIATLLYLWVGRVKTAYHIVFKEKRLSIDVVDSISILGTIAYQYYFWIALSLSIYFFSEQILAKTEDSSRQKLVNILGEQPRFVWVLIEGTEIKSAFEQLQANDIIVVNAGEIIPIDGVITQGIASIDQHRLTGEVQPAEKSVGESVFASTMILSGKLSIQVQKTGHETTAAQIGKILNEVANFKLSIQSRGKRLTDKAALPTLVLSTIALPLVGPIGALALMRNYPGANLRLMFPIALLNFLQTSSQLGILVKDGRSLELMSQVDTIVFDKTGTLTLEQPQVVNIYTCSACSEKELLEYAAIAEYRQTHPVALAILAAARERHLSLKIAQQSHYEIGYGIKVHLNGKLIRVGSDRFMNMEGIKIPFSIQTIHQQNSEQGHSLIMIAIDEQLVGAIALEATLRPEALSVIKQLKKRQLSLYIISGDHEEPTKNLAHRLGIENYFANTLPENKAQLIKQLQKEGKKVCFIGDGINDAIALNQADVSVSLSGASTIATDTAQIVLMDSNLNRLIDLFNITLALDTMTKTSITLSTIPGLISIGSVFIFHTGLVFSIVLGILGLSISIGNTMRPRLSKLG